MNSKHAIVINENGYKTEFVLVDFTEQGGESKEIPQAHTMQDGEILIYEGIPTALSMLKPRWNGQTWEEAATPKEITAAMPEPDETVVLPTLEDRLEALESAFIEMAGEIYG